MAVVAPGDIADTPPPDQTVYGPPQEEAYSRTQDLNPNSGGYTGPANIGSPSETFSNIGSAVSKGVGESLDQFAGAPAGHGGETFANPGEDELWKNFQDGLTVGANSVDTKARENALQGSIGSAIDNIEKASGTRIPSPYDNAYAEEARQQVIDSNGGKTPADLRSYADQVWLAQLGLYEKSLKDLYDKHPENNETDNAIRAAIQPALNMTDFADQWVKSGQDKASMDLAKSNGSVLPWLAQQGGSMIGGFRNPIGLMGLLVGGPELGIAKTAIGRIIEAGAGQAVTQAGLTGAQEPERQGLAAERGQEHGFYPVLRDLEDSALGGFIGGGLIHGIGEIGRLFKPVDQSDAIEEFLRQAQQVPPEGAAPGERPQTQWEKDVADFDAQQAAKRASTAVVPHEGAEPPPAPTEAQAEAREGMTPPPGSANLPRTTAITPAAIEARNLDLAAAPEPPPGYTHEDALNMYEGLIKAGEDPDLVAKPVAPFFTPEETAPTSPTSLSLPPVTSMRIGETFQKDNKPVEFQTFDPTTITTNANVFQYKGGGNAQGVTERLKGVEQWDVMAGSDPIVAYQWSDGRVDVADGHQRTGLAKALNAQGSLPEGTRLPGFLFKEADGWSPADVRAYAAKQNLQKGSGDVLDTARILRERPDIWDKSLPTSSPALKQAKGLSQLSDDGWGMVVNGYVKPNLAALVGQGIPDKAAHSELLKNIIDFKQADENSVRMMIADANAAGYREEEQNDIFGGAPITKSLLKERAAVYSRVIHALTDDKKIFGLLDREANRIEAAGNVLAGDENIAQSDRAGQLTSVLEKLAVRQGPVSAALNRAASTVADGVDPLVAARAFLRDIDRLIREEGLKLSIPPAIRPRTDIDITTVPGMEQATAELRHASPRVPDEKYGSHTKPIPEQRQAIFEDMRQRLIDAHEPVERADAAAAVIAARYVARADRVGRTDPETMYHGREISVESGTSKTERGQVDLKYSGPVVKLFNRRNPSTFMHEAAHIFLDELKKDAEESPAVADDLATVLKWMGVENARLIKTPQHEQFARAFEQYLREGKAPSSGLRAAFEKFKAWLRATYKSLVGLGKEIPDHIRAVMDRMIATDDEIAAARAEERGAARTPPPSEKELAAAHADQIGDQVVGAIKEAIGDDTPLGRELIKEVDKALAPEPAPIEPTSGLAAKPPEPLPFAGTKLSKTVDMGSTGLRPKGRGDGTSPIAAAQVAWSTAKQSGKPAIAVLTSQGWSVLRPTEGLAYGQPHIEVTPEGLARFYDQDVKAANFGDPAAIAADVPKALKEGAIGTLRFTSVPTSEQLDQIIDAGRAHEETVADRVFGPDAEQAKKLMRSNSESAHDKLEALVEKHGPEAGNLAYGTNNYPIVISDELKDLRRRLSDVEFAVDNAAHGDYSDLEKELSWAAPHLPEASAPESSHTVLQREAVLSVARAFQDIDEKGVDTTKALRGVVKYTAGRVGGDADDTRLLLERLSDFAKMYAAERPTYEKPAPGEQTTIPGVKPVTDAERAQAGAEKPMRGGEAAPPAGGLFDEDAKNQVNWLDMVPTNEGLVHEDELRESLKPETPEEKVFFQSVQTPAERAMAKLQQALALSAQQDLKKYFLSNRTIQGQRDMRQAAYDLFEDDGHSGHISVRFLAEHLTATSNAKIADALEHFSRRTVWSNGDPIGRRNNRKDFGTLQEAMFGEKTNPEMQALAKDVLETHDSLRELFNEKSGNAIPFRKNWGGPQSHNPNAVFRMGRQNWVEFIDPRLDWTQMYDPLKGALYPRPPEIQERYRILNDIWERIITDGGIDVKPGSADDRASTIANSRSDHRFLTFKDARSKIDYNRNCGEGDLLTQNLNHIRMMARDIALMHIFGPNPAGMLTWIKQGIEKEASEAMAGRPVLIEPLRSKENAMQKADKANRILDGYYTQFRGANYDQGAIALSGTILRNTTMGALLGSSIVPHAVSNPFIEMMGRYYAGIPIARTIPMILRSFHKASKAELLRAGLDVEQGAFSLGEAARYSSRLQKIANQTRWLPDRITALSGLQAFVEASKGAMKRDLAATLADRQATNWNDLLPQYRKRLAGSGITEKMWKIIQQATPYQPAVGSAPWITPTEIAAVNDPGAREASWHVGGYIHSQTEAAVPTSSIKSRQFIHGDSDPNTLFGQFRLSVGQFKGFIGSFMLTQLRANAEMAAGKGGILNPKIGDRRFSLKHAAAIWIAMTILGTVSYSIKQMLAGKEVPSLDIRTPEGRTTWLNGMLTGGAFGFLGDFLASDVSSYGRGILESLSGPAAGIVLDTGQFVWQNLHDAMTRQNPSRKSLYEKSTDFFLKEARANTPMATLWWLRAAFQRMVLDQLQYAIDPNATKKFRAAENRFQKENHRSLWWKMGEMLPDHWPWQHSQ